MYACPSLFSLLLAPFQPFGGCPGAGGEAEGMVQAATGGAGGGFCRPRRAGTNSPSSVTRASRSFLISDESAYLLAVVGEDA
jgi:hypothetical protein